MYITLHDICKKRGGNTNMKKFVIALCVFALCCTLCVSAFAVGTEAVAKTKNHDIKVTVIDDFSTYSGEVTECGNASYAFDGKKLTFTIASNGVAYGGPTGDAYKSPAASAEGINALYNSAKYIGMRVKNVGGVAVSIALEKNDGNDAWMTQLWKDEGCMLASESTGIVNAGYEDIGNIYRGKAVTIPANFDGWLFIPFSSLRISVDENVTGDRTNDRCIMSAIRFCGINSNDKDAVLEIDDFCLTAEDLVADGNKPTADFSVIAYAVAAITGCGALVVAKKRG